MGMRIVGPPPQAAEPLILSKIYAVAITWDFTISIFLCSPCLQVVVFLRCLVSIGREQKGFLLFHRGDTKTTFEGKVA
jgi:hypothetical protein